MTSTNIENGSLICIDPGLSGAIACRVDEKVHVFKMPDTPKEFYVLILSLKNKNDFCWIEQVGTYMPGNSGPAAVTFARHCGQIDMALIAAGISHDTVMPKKWEYFITGKPNYPKIPKDTPAIVKRKILAQRKSERKNKIKAKMQCLYPDIKVTLTNADALGILTWAEQNKGN